MSSTKGLLWLTGCYPVISRKEDDENHGGENSPSGDSTKSALIHLPAAGEGSGCSAVQAVISRGAGRWPLLPGWVATLCRSLMKVLECKERPAGSKSDVSERLQNPLICWHRTQGVERRTVHVCVCAGTHDLKEGFFIKLLHSKYTQKKNIFSLTALAFSRWDITGFIGPDFNSLLPAALCKWGFIYGTRIGKITASCVFGCFS